MTKLRPSRPARPILRWAGSKRWLLPALLERVPERFGTYYEPFLGGGSLFFALAPEKAVLSDALSPLMDTYRAIRDNPSAVLRYIRDMQPDRELFDVVRRRRSRGRYRRAADFLYLNRTGWNALYRVNAAGQYNVPYGRPKTDRLVDPWAIRQAAELMRKPTIQLLTADFRDALRNVKAGDVVFLDPPYVTGHNNNGFVDYNELLFKWEDQERLAREARRMKDAGATVLVTNASHDAVLELYSGFEVEPVTRWSTIAGDRTKRTQVTEALLW